MEPFIYHRKTRSVRRSLKLATIVAMAVLPLQQSAMRPAYAQVNPNDPIRVTLNGNSIDFGGVSPLQQSGRVLVPLRGVFEALGAFVDYNNETQAITATQGDTRVQLTVGSARAYVNGQSRTLDVPAQVQSGRTLVPLRFVSEALGANVAWNDALRTVQITTNAPVPVDNGTGNNGDNGDDNTLPAASRVRGSVVSVDNTPPGSVTVRVRDTNNSPDAGQTKTYTFADNTRFYRRITGRVTRNQTPTYDAPIALSNASNSNIPLLPGDDVTLRLNSNSAVTYATTSVSLITARIRDVQGNQIILDDSAGTTLNAGNLAIFDAQNQQANDTSVLQPGQRVVLFVAPSTRRVVAVSEAPSVLRQADSANVGGNDTTPPDNTLPDNSLPNDGSSTGTSSDTPQINLVQQNTTRPLRSGDTLSVTVRGTPNQRATFSVLPDVPEVPMNEDANRPGVYTGTYTVQSGDNVRGGRVSAYLRNNNGREAFQQSQTSVTIDTTPPRITGISPVAGSTIPSSQSNIVINATDVGGSGLDRADVSFNGQSVAPQDITVNSNSVSVIAPDNLSGQVSVNVTVFDRAGNAARRTFSYFVNDNGNGNNSGNNGNGGAIISLTHNATRDTIVGDRVTVNMRAGVGGNATFDVLGNDSTTVIRNVPMTEISDGRYRGSFSVPSNVSSPIIIRGRFTDTNGNTSTEDTTAPISVNGGDQNGNMADLTISTPRDGGTVGNNLVVRGSAQPNATVEVDVAAQGSRYLIFNYSNDLGTQQVQADGNGNWSTSAYNLPSPSGVSNLKYVITATQTDSSNRQSQPVTVTVTPRGSNDNGSNSNGNNQ